MSFNLSLPLLPFVGRAVTARGHMIQVACKLGEPVSIVFSQAPSLKRDT